MEWRRSCPAGAVGGFVEWIAHRAVAGRPNEIMGGEIGVLKQLSEVGESLGFAVIEGGCGLRCAMDAVGMIRCFGIGLRQ